MSNYLQFQLEFEQEKHHPHDFKKKIKIKKNHFQLKKLLQNLPF